MNIKKKLILLILTTLTLSGCQTFTDSAKQVRQSFDNTVQYSGDKANQIKQSVEDLKQGVTNTVDTVNNTVNQVKDAGDKMNQAAQELNNAGQSISNLTNPTQNNTQ